MLECIPVTILEHPSSRYHAKSFCMIRQTMHYEFFTGPLDLEKVYPGLFQRSIYFYNVQEEYNYIKYKGREIVVVKHDDLGWLCVSCNEEVQEYVQNSQPSVLTRKVNREDVWRPYAEPGGEGDWLSLLFDQGKIIGFYKGSIYLDNLGRRFSSHSFINISPQ
nr:hypothetical protein Cplu_143 [Cedratvirus plubellavi]